MVKCQIDSNCVLFYKMENNKMVVVVIIVQCALVLFLIILVRFVKPSMRPWPLVAQQP